VRVDEENHCVPLVNDLRFSRGIAPCWGFSRVFAGIRAISAPLLRRFWGSAAIKDAVDEGVPPKKILCGGGYSVGQGFIACFRFVAFVFSWFKISGLICRKKFGNSAKTANERGVSIESVDARF
jgi:hypothetical protein